MTAFHCRALGFSALVNILNFWFDLLETLRLLLECYCLIYTMASKFAQLNRVWFDLTDF